MESYLHSREFYSRNEQEARDSKESGPEPLGIITAVIVNDASDVPLTLEGSSELHA